MSVSRRSVGWCGLAALALESETLRIVVVPDLGGKIASIYDRVANTEWLAGPGNRSVRLATPGATYVDYDMSGWDEMFPTISSCVYSEPGPYAGRELPDHGEVWSLPWSIDDGPDDEISLTVGGRVLPYRLTRIIRITGGRALSAHYQLENLGQHPFAYLWAPHPQFACSGGSAVLPAQITEVVNVLPESWGWGEPGTRHGWPETKGADGRRARIDKVRGVETRAGRKYYVPPDIHADCVQVRRPGPMGSLTLRWQPAELPYLGLWIDEGAFNGQPALTPEPATAYYDSLELACRLGCVSWVPAGETRHWSLAVDLASDAGA